MKISKGTLIRTITLVLALINQVLTVTGHTPLPINDEVIAELFSTGVVIITSLIAWWKNSSFTQEAIKADTIMKKLKNKEIANEDVNKLI